MQTDQCDISEKSLPAAQRPTRGGRLRRVLLNTLLVLGSVLLASAVGEVVVRTLPARWVPELYGINQQRYHLCAASENPQLYFELVPNNRESEVNADGYRGPLFSEEKSPGVRRIIALGDSSFFGWGVAERQGCLRQLEKLLNQDGTGAVEVVNLAVPGYNSQQEAELLRVRGLKYQPDWIIVGYDHNDAEPRIGIEKRASLIPDRYGRNALRSRLLCYLVRKWYLARITRDGRDPGGNTRQDGYVVEGPLWDRHLEALAEIGRIARQRDVPVLLVIFDAWARRDPGRTSEHYQAIHAKLVPFFRQAGFDVLDSYDLFQDYMAQNNFEDTRSLWMSIMPKDGHPNPKAHRMLAEAMYERLRTWSQSP
jgi:lysophospholipase L1-like esterase